MNRNKTAVAIMLVLCMLISIMPAAFASTNDALYKGKSWDKLTESLIKQYEKENGGKTPSVSLGYINLVTGEEHYYKGDEYMDAYSMFTVPLNMYFTEQISKGKMDWDTEISGEEYSMLLERSVVFSSNARSRFLVNEIGTFREYRDAICPYMGLTPKKADSKFYEKNLFTARQMIRCLDNLYKGGERFPELINAMLEASPNEYFCSKNQGFDVAHKFTYNKDESKGREYVGDCAIIFTDEPIAIVMFCDTVNNPQQALADYCGLMCSYAQANRKPKPSPTPVPTPSPSEAPAEASPAPSAVPSAAPTQAPAPQPEQTEQPSVAPTPAPTAEPQIEPTPSAFPSDMYAPTPESVPFSPTPAPTETPVEEPNPASTETPSEAPSAAHVPVEQADAAETESPVPTSEPVEVTPPAATPSPVQPGDAATRSATYSSGREIADFALQYVGYDYVYGEQSPEKGFDCSGLVYYVYGQFGYSLNRVAAAQAKNGTHVELDSLEPGDVLCFYNWGSAIGHVGIYIGGGEYVHAESSNTGVVVSPLSSRTCKIEARRIL